MKKYFFSSLVIATIVVAAALVSSCDEKEAAETQKDDILEVLEHKTELADFVDAVKRLDFAAEVQGNQLTVFAVKNGGMSGIGDNAFVIKRHIVNGRYPTSELYNGREFTALDGTKLIVEAKGVDFYVNGERLLEVISARHSVVYVVEKSLPATYEVYKPNAGQLLAKMKEIYDDRYEYEYIFDYDQQKRISKIDFRINRWKEGSALFTYSANKIEFVVNEHGEVIEKIEFLINGNTIYASGYSDDKSEQRHGWDLVSSVSSGILTINNDKYLTKTEIISTNVWNVNGEGIVTIIKNNIVDYVYTDGNLTKRTFTSRRNGEIQWTYVENMKYDNKNSPFLNCATPQWLLMEIFDMDINNNMNNMIEKERNDGYNKTTYEYEYEYDSAGFPVKQNYTSVGSGVTTLYYK